MHTFQLTCNLQQLLAECHLLHDHSCLNKDGRCRFFSLRDCKPVMSGFFTNDKPCKAWKLIDPIAWRSSTNATITCGGKENPQAILKKQKKNYTDLEYFSVLFLLKPTLHWQNWLRQWVRCLLSEVPSRNRLVKLKEKKQVDVNRQDKKCETSRG